MAAVGHDRVRDLERVTSIVVTHHIRDAFYVATHHATRANGRPEIGARAVRGRSHRITGALL